MKEHRWKTGRAFALLLFAALLVTPRAEAATLALSPLTPKVAPLGMVTFSATGGSGAGFVFQLAGNASGGSVDPRSGVYHAGRSGDVQDRMQVTDSAGNFALTNIEVGAALRIGALAGPVPPRGTARGVASGGGGAYRWTLVGSASGGSVDPVTGDYRAGVTGNVVDRLRVTDSVNATDEIDVVIGPGVGLTPVESRASPRVQIRFLAEGGTGNFVWALDPNRSGGSIAADGSYLSGTNVGVTDVVVAQDDLGNRATATVLVVAPPPVVPPDAGSAPPAPSATSTIASIEGAGGFGCTAARASLPRGSTRAALALVLSFSCLAGVRRRRRWRRFVTETP